MNWINLSLINIFYLLGETIFSLI